MDPIRMGSDLRLLRRRRGWTQERLAEAARLPRWVVSAAERGHGDRLPLHRLVAIASALGAYLSVRILLDGEGLDRLRDRRHASAVERMVAILVSDGWEVATEVSFNVFGERGSIDILAFHPASRSLLVVEVKSVVPDIGGMLMTLDRKVRLGPDLARARGWSAATVSRMLVLPEHRTSRRRVSEHAATFEVAFPARTRDVQRWLQNPVGEISGLLFLPSDQHADKRRHLPARPRPSKAARPT
jgi:transcriptional regulator with XRE-family HTH domain